VYDDFDAPGIYLLIDFAFRGPRQGITASDGTHHGFFRREARTAGGTISEVGGGDNIDHAGYFSTAKVIYVSSGSAGCQGGERLA